MSYKRPPLPEVILEMEFSELQPEIMQQEYECDQIASKIEIQEAQPEQTDETRDWAARAKGAMRFKRTAIRQMSQRRKEMQQHAGQEISWNGKFVWLAEQKLEPEMWEWLKGLTDKVTGIELEETA